MKRSADPNSDKMQAEFRQKLENFQSAPTDNLWDKIELSLDKEEALVYKNRFRVYSRLAAACLLLLLAFGAFFIPNKLKQLKGENAEIAATKNPETNSKPSVQPQNSDLQIARSESKKNTSETGKSGIRTSENDMVSAEKTMSAVTENPGIDNSEIPDLASETKAAERNKNNFLSGIETEKTIAFQAAKVKPQAKTSGSTLSGNARENAVELPENDMISGAKTAVPETALAENIAAVEPGIAAVRPAIVMAPAVTKPAVSKNSEAIMASKKASPKSNKAVEFSGKQETEIAAAFSNKTTTGQVPEISQINTSTEENNRNALKKESFKLLSFLNPKTPLLQNAAQANAILPDTNILATLPEMKDGSETTTLLKETSKTGKWLLALGYSGRSFNPEMQLASQAKVTPNMGSNLTYQEQLQNVAQYEAAIQEFNEETRSAYSQGAALQVAYKISKNWQVQTGLNYFRHQAQTTSHYAFSNTGFVNTGINPQPGYTQAPDWQPVLQTVLENSFDPAKTEISQTPATKTTYTFQQIGVPVNLRFQTNSPSVYYFAGAGFAMNLLNNAIIEHQEEKVNYTPVSSGTKYYSVTGAPQHHFRKWMPSVSLQAGVGYHLAAHWQIELALEGDQFLKPLIEAEERAGASQKNPASVGASLKLGYSF